MKIFKNHEVDYIHSDESLFEEDSNINQEIGKRVKILPNMTDILKSKLKLEDDIRFNSNIPEGWLIWITYEGDVEDLELGNYKNKYHPMVGQIIRIMKDEEMDEVGPIGFDPKKGHCVTQMR